MSSPIGGTTYSSPTSSGTSPGSSLDPTNQLGANAFLQLLIAEMQNQDPTQPMDGKDMIAQLAQLNQTQFAQQGLVAQQENLASSLIGKAVVGSVNGQTVTGMVSVMSVSGSSVTVTVNGQPIDVSNITQVAATTADLTTTTTGSGGTTTTGSGGTTTTGSGGTTTTGSGGTTTTRSGGTTTTGSGGTTTTGSGGTTITGSATATSTNGGN